MVKKRDGPLWAVHIKKKNFYSIYRIVHFSSFWFKASKATKGNMGIENILLPMKLELTL
jgi:hypothetical protein